jgi:hypothetical protein
LDAAQGSGPDYVAGYRSFGESQGPAWSCLVAVPTVQSEAWVRLSELRCIQEPDGPFHHAIPGKSLRYEDLRSRQAGRGTGGRIARGSRSAGCPSAYGDFLDRHRRDTSEELRKGAFVPGIKVPDEDEAHPGVRGQMPQQLGERFQAAGGGADADDGRGVAGRAVARRGLGLRLGASFGVSRTVTRDWPG